MTEIDLGKPAKNAGDFYILRSQALSVYAGLEQSLCQTMSNALGADLPTTAVIFFKIVNTRSRNQIIEALIAKRHGSTFEAFWHGIPNTQSRKGLMNLVSELDSKRNEIVHWHVARVFGGTDQEPTDTLELHPPNFWAETQTIPVTIGDLAKFSAKAEFAQRAMNMFNAFVTHAVQNEDWQATWREIFQQPCVYPPPVGHPLAPKPEAL